MTGEREDGMPQMGSQPLKVNDCALAANCLWCAGYRRKTPMSIHILWLTNPYGCQERDSIP